jgi:hypothetical protein
MKQLYAPLPPRTCCSDLLEEPSGPQALDPPEHSPRLISLDLHETTQVNTIIAIPKLYTESPQGTPANSHGGPGTF